MPPRPARRARAGGGRGSTRASLSLPCAGCRGLRASVQRARRAVPPAGFRWYPLIRPWRGREGETAVRRRQAWSVGAAGGRGNPPCHAPTPASVPVELVAPVVVAVAVAVAPPTHGWTATARGRGSVRGGASGGRGGGAQPTRSGGGWSGGRRRLQRRRRRMRMLLFLLLLMWHLCTRLADRESRGVRGRMEGGAPAGRVDGRMRARAARGTRTMRRGVGDTGQRRRLELPQAAGATMLRRRT